MVEYYGNNDYRDYLMHYGVKGMKWGKHLKRKAYEVMDTAGSIVSDIERKVDHKYRRFRQKNMQREANKRHSGPVSRRFIEEQSQLGDNHRRTTYTSYDYSQPNIEVKKRNERDLKPGQFNTDGHASTYRNPSQYANTNSEGRSTKRSDYKPTNNVYATKRSSRDIDRDQERGKKRTEQQRKRKDFSNEQYIRETKIPETKIPETKIIDIQGSIHPAGTYSKKKKRGR